MKSKHYILPVILLAILSSCSTPVPTQPIDTRKYVLYFPNVNRNIIDWVGIDSATTMVYVPKISSIGVSWIRGTTLWWKDIEPVRGTILFDKLVKFDNELKLFYQYHLNTVLMIHNAPDWAAESSNCGPVKDTDALVNFFLFIVDRYYPAPYYVRYFELWNEADVPTNLVPPANGFGCWGDGAKYANAISKIYDAVHLKYPDVKIVFTGLMLDNPKQTFLEDALKAKAKFDVLNFHGYDYYEGNGNYFNPSWNTRNIPVLSAKIVFVKNLLSKYQYDVQIINSEESLLCDVSCGIDYENTKAKYIVDLMELAHQNGLLFSMWYDMTGKWRNGDLVYSGNNFKPAFIALENYLHP